MAKKQTFADKVAKATRNSSEYCAKCDSQVNYVRQVRSVFSDQTHAWKFKEGHVRVCKCNQQEVYG